LRPKKNPSQKHTHTHKKTASILSETRLWKKLQSDRKLKEAWKTKRIGTVVPASLLAATAQKKDFLGEC
jgi:hypothetical protein